MTDEKFLKEEMTEPIPAVEPALDRVESTGGSQGNSNGKLKNVLEWVKFVCITLVLYYFLLQFVFQVNIVQGRSMFPTLKPQDRVVVNKLRTTFSRPYDRGDIVTINAAKLDNPDIDKDIVKRIVALPGETVEIKDGQVFVNDKKLPEKYLPSGVVTELIGSYSRVLLGKDSYFVLGDNRSHSTDSRVFGVVPAKAIMGYLAFRIFPLYSLGRVK